MPNPFNDLTEVRERAFGALLGMAVGDALGAAVEFMTRSEIRGRFGVLREIKGGGWLNLPAGAVTDDTEMSLCIARSIGDNGFVLQDIASRFANWLKSRPIDVGNTCRRGIRRFILDGSLSAPPNEGDAGNGAAMRMAPVAIASLGSRAVLERWALAQAHVTHHHALSDAACLLVGRLVHLACAGKCTACLRLEADTTVARCPSFRFTPYRGLATTYVPDTIQTVLHTFFGTAAFEDCLVATVNQGGDADTTGAIVGAVAGAHYGPAAIPRRWVKKLDRSLVLELEALAGRLVDRSPLGQSHGHKDGAAPSDDGATFNAPCATPPCARTECPPLDQVATTPTQTA